MQNIKIKLEDLFDIVEDKDRKSRTIYRLRFKSDKTLLKNGMTNKREHLNRLAYRWIQNNPNKAADMVFELQVLV